MKPFNLEEALAGKLCVTSGGQEVRIKYDLSIHYHDVGRPLVGYVKYQGDDWEEYELLWRKNGAYSDTDGYHGMNIVGMKEEPQPLVDVGKLPAPLKEAKAGDEVWFDMNGKITPFTFDIYASDDVHKMKTGKLFATEADAKAWLDAMVGARR